MTDRSLDTPITSQDSMWGNIPITDDELALINSSPLMVQELNEYQNAVDAGTAFKFDLISNNPQLLQTVPTSNGTQTQLQIQIGTAVAEGNTATFIGDLAYELGHFVNYSNDLATYNQIIGNLSPDDPSYATMSALAASLAESESQANNYAIQQQILQATTSNPNLTSIGQPVQIHLNGDSLSDGALQSAFDQAFAADKANGVNPANDLGMLAQAVAGITPTVPTGFSGADAGLNFIQYYEKYAAAVHGYYYPDSTPPAVSQTGLQGAQDGTTTGVDFTYNPDGSLQSVTLDDSSGQSQRFSFTGSVLSSATVFDEFGNIVSTMDYSHNANGSYSATVLNGQGDITSQYQFSAGGSGNETFYDATTGDRTAENVYSSDGSQWDYTILSDGNQTGIEYNAAGQEIGYGNYYYNDPDGDILSQEWTINPVTGKAVTETMTDVYDNTTTYTFNSNGSASATVVNDAGTVTDLLTFDSSGNETQDINYNIRATNPYIDYVETFSNGVETSDSFYNSSGAETAKDVFNPDNSQTDYTYNSDGSQFFYSYNAAGKETEYGQFAADGSGYQEYFNPATSKETGETDFAADGSQTDYTYNSDGSQSFYAYNAAGTETEYGQFAADGSGYQEYYDPTTGKETGETDFAADGSQTDYTYNSDGSQSFYAYNAAGQETEYGQFASDGSGYQEYLNPATGKETGETDFAANGSQVDYTFNSDGSQTIEAFNAAGKETEYADLASDGSGTAYFYDPTSGKETGQNDYYADGSQTDYVLNTDGTQDAFVYDPSGNETEYAEFNPDGSHLDITYNPLTEQATGVNFYNTDGSQTDYTIASDGSETAVSYGVSGQPTGETWFAANGDETQSDTFSGNTTYVNLFQPGSDYSFEQEVFAGGSLVQQNQYNPANGDLTEVALFDGGPYADEVLYAEQGSAFFNEIEVYDPQTGALLGLSNYNPTTGALINSSGANTGSDSDDSGYDDDSAYGYWFGGGYGGGYWGGYGMAGSKAAIQSTLGSNIGTIAQSDLASGNATGAAAAQSALHQAAATATASSGATTSVFEGGHWATQTITWSVSPDASGYENEIAQAFSAWAKASGLQFEEVSTASSADIQLGFGELNTATTGVVGYTTGRTEGSQIVSAKIDLEDPAQDALVPGPDGQMTYTGTDASFEQVVMHEIGHALGLADNADQNSIMYYDLGSNNRTLDATDLTGIQTLYGEGATAAGPALVNGQVSQLIQAMAAFAPAVPTTSELLTAGQLQPQHQLLAVAAH